MKKIWLLTTLLAGSLLLTGCLEVLDKEWMVNEVNEKVHEEIDKSQTEYSEEKIAEYSWVFHADFIDDNNSYLWDFKVTWDSCWRLKILKWIETWYIYKYTFDIWCDMYDMLYHNISVTFESPVLLNWEEDFLSWNSKWDNVPFVKVSSIWLYAWHWGVQISNPEPATSLLYMRCFNDTSVDPRFRNWLVPAYSSWITQLTTISNQTIDIPFINHSSAVNFYYWYSEQYQWNIMDQCVLHLSHTNENTIQLPFKLSWWFWDSALILWFTNRESDSYCRHRDTEIQVSNWMTCYIYANDIENVIDIKLWDISDMIN